MQRTKPKRGGPAPTKQAGRSARNRRRRQRRKSRQMLPGGVVAGGLSECAIAYLRALSLPFGEFPEAPCIPDTITLPSHKFAAHIRGSLTIGTQGVGWVAFDPWEAVWNNGGFSGAFKTYPLVYTTSTFAGTSYAWSVAGGVPTVGVAGAASTSPYDISSFASSAVVARLVGAGIRIQYCGTELQRGGRVVMYRARGNADIDHSGGGQTAALLLRDPAMHFSPVDRSWKEITYLPSDTTFLTYENPNSNWNPNFLASNDQNVLLVLIEGAVAGQSFTFEAISHFEVIGPVFPPSASHADPVGHGAIMSAIPQTTYEAGNTMFNYMLNAANTALGQTSQALLGGAAYVGANVLMGRRNMRRLTAGV